MDEFSQSRFRLESRYHHVLVDEFQDTSRAQWELVSLLIQSWGEGLGLATQPSIFIVGDRKQSIYRFRDAEVAVLAASRRATSKRCGRPAARGARSAAASARFPSCSSSSTSCSRKCRSRAARADDFTYGEADRFPVDTVARRLAGAARCSALATGRGRRRLRRRRRRRRSTRILREETVRDRKTGVPRAARGPGDIAILFRSRASHREFEHELELRGIPTYVYKGLGFFDADEIKDVSALMRYLADPWSDLRAAAFLRSRFVRISDRGLAALGPKLAAALTGAGSAGGARRARRRRSARAPARSRAHVRHWLRAGRSRAASRSDRAAAPGDRVRLRAARAPAAAGVGKPQEDARARSAGSRTAATRRSPRIADHLDSLTAGDESNAVHRGARRRQPDDGPRGERARVPDRLRRQPGEGRQRPAASDSRHRGRRGEAPSVSVGPFVSDTDEAEREREKHETRRLLYVALTRARDRLYLSSVLKNGVMQPGRGSLAEVSAGVGAQPFQPCRNRVRRMHSSWMGGTVRACFRLAHLQTPAVGHAIGSRDTAERRGWRRGFFGT